MNRKVLAKLVEIASGEDGSEVAGEETPDETSAQESAADPDGATDEGDAPTDGEQSHD